MSAPRYRAVPPRRASRVRQALGRLGTLAHEVARVGTERWSDGMTQVVREAARELEQLGLDRARAVLSDLQGHIAVSAPGAGAAGQRGSLGSGLVGALPGMPVRGRATAGSSSLASTLAAAAARRTARSLYAQVSPARHVVRALDMDPLAVAAHFSRALLKFALLADAARAYPAGPAPRAAVEPLLRGVLEPDERPRLKGRVLVPLCERAGRQLAWDLEASALVSVPAGELEPGTCALVGRLVAEHHLVNGGVTPAQLRRVTPGVPVGAGSDRRVLSAAEPHLRAVMRTCLHQLADPFVDAPAPRLVGPLEHARTDRHLRLEVLADARGDLCSVPGRLVPSEGWLASSSSWYLLAEPRSREGQLELLPLLAWAVPRGRRPERVLPDVTPAGARALPCSEPILDDCADVLADLQASGLARGLASRAAVRDLAGAVAAEGHGALAERLRALPDAPEDRSGHALHGALHLVDRLRGAPRVLARRAEPEISK